MSKFEKIKKYYDNGLWCTSRLKDAVDKGWISESEYTLITGAYL